MVFNPPGNELLNLIRSAQSRVVVVAPYIKSTTIRDIIKNIPGDVSECVCVTRWLPGDIASGVCDIEIFNDLMHVKGGRLLIHPHLHAKYYSNGLETLVGSANLTSRGLGWHTPSNVELLVTLPADFPGLADWESTLLSLTVEATDQLRDEIFESAQRIKNTQAVSLPPEVERDCTARKEFIPWVPLCPTPERLWDVYQDRGLDFMVRSAFDAARNDLAVLSPPRGLTEDLFKAYMTGMLERMPLFSEIDRLTSSGLIDTKASELLSQRLEDGAGLVDDYISTWQIIKAWLIHFFPEKYRLEPSQEMLVKGREIIS